ncbi:kinase-like domain-containing protein [Mycena galericulata]|nr:kinase-like domain-containing protein [Mycena galericulata]
MAPVRDTLTPGEIFWRDHQPWLEECGYSLRPRFRPGWIPSWKTDPEETGILSEDGIVLSPSQIIDAIRIEDGASVALKVISKTAFPDEARIQEYFSSKELASAPRNHCLPLLDQLSPPDAEDKLILVMKLMRGYDSPRFDTFGEAVEFFHQIFEGLQFMHHHNVAHRDCNSMNIMMDGQHLFPQGFHPQTQEYRPDKIYKRAKYYTRTQRPVKYYFIDFGFAKKFGPGEDTRAYPLIGGDDSAPEFQSMQNLTTQLDPFPTDIYYLGNLIRTEFLDGYQRMAMSRKFGFDFMRPLVSDMVQTDPAKRPNIDEVVTRFAEMRRGLSAWKLRCRVVKESDFSFHLPRIVGHWVRRVGFVLMRVPAIPAPDGR